MNEDYKNEAPEESPRVMSREDVHEYRGLTLNESGEEERKEENVRSGFHVHVVGNTSAMPWWKKALFWGAAAAVVAVFLTVAWFFIVGGMILAGAAALIYFLKRYFRR